MAEIDEINDFSMILGPQGPYRAQTTGIWHEKWSYGAYWGLYLSLYRMPGYTTAGYTTAGYTTRCMLPGYHG